MSLRSGKVRPICLANAALAAGLSKLTPKTSVSEVSIFLERFQPDRLKLLGSTAGEGQDVDGEKDIFLAAVVAELHGFPLVAEKSELRGRITDLSVILATCDFSACGKRGLPRGQQQPKARERSCVSWKFPSDQDTRVSSSLHLPFMQYHAMPKIFHIPCASAIGGAKGAENSYEDWTFFAVSRESSL